MFLASHKICYFNFFYWEEGYIEVSYKFPKYLIQKELYEPTKPDHLLVSLFLESLGFFMLLSGVTIRYWVEKGLYNVVNS